MSRIAWREPNFSRGFPPCEIPHGDKGYDSDVIWRQVERDGATPNIPAKAKRKWKNCFSPLLYRNRNVIERMLRRLKDFRRIAARCDRNATNFLAAVCIAATVSGWLSVWTLTQYLPRPSGETLAGVGLHNGMMTRLHTRVS